MKPLISTAVVLASVMAFTSPVAADNVCMMQGEMRAALIDWYGEIPIAAPSDANTQIWASAVTGTWTMIRTYADGRACVMAQGDDWMSPNEQQEILALVDG